MIRTVTLDDPEVERSVLEAAAGRSPRRTTGSPCRPTAGAWSTTHAHQVVLAAPSAQRPRCGWMATLDRTEDGWRAPVSGAAVACGADRRAAPGPDTACAGAARLRAARRAGTHRAVRRRRHPSAARPGRRGRHPRRRGTSSTPRPMTPCPFTAGRPSPGSARSRGPTLTVTCGCHCAGRRTTSSACPWGPTECAPSCVPRSRCTPTVPLRVTG